MPSRTPLDLPLVALLGCVGDFSIEEYLDLQRIVHKVAEAMRVEVGAERMYVLTLDRSTR